MIGRIIGYLAAVLVTAYLFFMYDAYVISGLLLFLILYFFIELLWMLLMRGKLVPVPDRVPAMGEPGKRIRAGVTLRNQSKRMDLRFDFTVKIHYAGRKGGKKKRYRGHIRAGEKKTFWCEFEPEMCGNVEVCVDKVRIYDFLGILCISRRCRKNARVKVMPEFRLMPLEITRRTRGFQADADVYSGERRGDDPSEIYQVREYRTRDSLKDIHWKLSAREGELMIKERGFPLGCTVLIWFEADAGTGGTAGISRLLEKGASLSVTLAEEKCIHMAAWYEEKNERIVKLRVDDEESCYEMIWRLLDLEPCTDREKRRACYEDAFRGQEFGSIVTVDSEGNLIQDGKKQELLRL